jgi:hypothetical protein
MLALALCLSTGCGLIRELPPPPSPDRVAPILPEESPAPAGMGQVAIATSTDEPALVEEVTGHMEGIASDGTFVSGLTYQTVCSSTPCLATLPVGEHAVRLTSLQDPNHSGSGSLEISPQAMNYRYALGHQEDHAGALVGGILLLSLSPVALVPGLLVLNNSSTGEKIGGGALLVTSAALAIVGTIVLHHATFISQEGTGVEWPR